MLTDLAANSLAEANEANFVEFLKLTACLPGSVLEEHPDMTVILPGTDVGGFNVVVGAKLGESKVAGTVAELRARLDADSKGWSWIVGPASRPTDLDTRLEEAGLRNGGVEYAMALKMSELREQPSPEGLEIKRVADDATLRDCIEAMAEGFGPPTTYTAEWERIFRCAGYGKGYPTQLYVGCLKGKPVASSVMFRGAGVAGLYSIATVPRVRRRGIGTALTLAPLLDARAEGYRVAVLQATRMGSPIYSRLGFRSYGNFYFFGNAPSSAG